MMGDQANYVCDLCGKSADDLEAITAHLQEEHGIEEPTEVGSMHQADGIITLRHGNGEEIVIDLEKWVKDQLSPQPAMPQPSLEDLQQWQDEGGCYATDGCWVETDGRCDHGHPSWLLHLRLI